MKLFVMEMKTFAAMCPYQVLPVRGHAQVRHAQVRHAQVRHAQAHHAQAQVHHAQAQVRQARHAQAQVQVHHAQAQVHQVHQVHHAQAQVHQVRHAQVQVRHAQVHQVHQSQAQVQVLLILILRDLHFSFLPSVRKKWMPSMKATNTSLSVLPMRKKKICLSTLLQAVN